MCERLVNMCLFITAAIPGDAKVDCVSRIFSKHKLAFEKIANEFVLAQLNPNDVYVSTTRGHCDCGSALGSVRQDGRDDTQNFEDEVVKLRAKRWSEGKIQRWLEQKEQTKEKQLREDEARITTGIPGANYWHSFISELLLSRCTNKVGLLLHFYKGSVEGERVKITTRKRIPVEEITPQQLLEMEYDVLYEFVNQPRKHKS